MVNRMQRSTWVESGAPRWLADYSSRDHLVPGGVKLNPAEFPIEDAVTVTVGTGGAAVGATSVPVQATSGPIPAGTVLNFTGAGEFALVTAPVVRGATSIAVEALDAAIEAGDTATYPGTGKKYVPSGKVVGRHAYAEDATRPRATREETGAGEPLWGACESGKAEVATGAKSSR